MSTEFAVAKMTIAQTVAGISSMATRHVLAALASDYERNSGLRIAVESVGGVDAARRVESGEAFDFVVLAAPAIDTLVAAGRVDPQTRIAVARSGVAIAVAAGAQRPDLGSEQRVREAVLAARSVGCSTGPSGRHVARLFERWGIASIIAPRTVEAPPGVAVGTLVARGDVEIGFQQLSELMHLPGIDVVGMLPPDIQQITVFCGATCVSTARREAARGFLSYCASPRSEAIKRHHGMEP